MAATFKLFRQAIPAFLCAVVFHSAFGADKYEEQLNKALAEYRAMPKSKDVKRLVELHFELSVLVKEMQKANKRGYDYWRDGYQEIGLSTENWTDLHALQYSGKLLEEAHMRNPDSPYRVHTLFAAIPGVYDRDGPRSFVGLAESYLREFPDGPYVASVYRKLGWFYDDLGKTLRQIVKRGLNEGMPKGGKEYHCFASYITQEPYEMQMKKAFSLAVENLERAIAVDPSSEGNQYIRKYLSVIKSGRSDTWTWCTAD